jgi:DNA repair protein RecN (Recombination protein N)
MLSRLTIRDFVLVDRLELDFLPGFCALTGETGAGKSILIDAIAFALGERSDTGAIRNGATRAEVVAEFDLEAVPTVPVWLSTNDLESADGHLILRRVLDTNGRSRAYINGSPVPLQQVREVAEYLVDIHGQHAHQSLLRPEAQRSLLDAHAGLTPLAENVAAAWRAWRSTENALAAASENSGALQQERSQLEWQIQEVDSLDFSMTSWEALNAEHVRLAHAASLLDGTQQALVLLTEGDAACAGQLGGALERLDTLLDFDPALADLCDLLRSAQTEVVEAASTLRRYVDRLELDPGRLDEIERRIEAIVSCARKFRTVPERLPELLAAWRQRLGELGECGDLAALAARVAAAAETFRSLAGRLSNERIRAAERLAADVSRLMQQLALGGGRFEIACLAVDTAYSGGLEQVEFRIAGLAGGEARPLARVASGGELSRISLAIQVVTSQAAKVPTLIFDEVDVGIGGGVAEVVGRLLGELGQQRQVLCVTHLPQVAARADRQWQVSKENLSGQLCSRVSILDESGRIEEIARMLGGMEITAITRQHAREMLGMR